MKQGVLLFANNIPEIDYVSMAQWSARRIQRHLGLPVTVITDSDIQDRSMFDQVIVHRLDTHGSRHFADLEKTVTWKNHSRPSAYKLSPYDHTLLLDVDYVVCSDLLNSAFECNQDIIAPRWAYDITGLRDYEDLNYFGSHRMPMSWATVVCFKKSRVAEQVFSIMDMVRNNWDHYRNLYRIRRSTYRNDHALSIALNIVDGHSAAWPGIPWRMASLDPQHGLSQISQDRFKISYVDTQGKQKHITVDGVDFHAMGKTHLEKIIANSR